MVGTGGRYCGLVTQSYSCSFFSKSEKLKYNVPASFTATGGHGTQHLTVKYKSTSSERPPCFLASAVPLLFPVLSLNTPRRCWGQQPSWEHKDKGHVLGIATEEEMPWIVLVTAPLPCWNTMAKASYKRKHVVGSVRGWGHEHPGEEHGGKQVGRYIWSSRWELISDVQDADREQATGSSVCFWNL